MLLRFGVASWLPSRVKTRGLRSYLEKQCLLPVYEVGAAIAPISPADQMLRLVAGAWRFSLTGRSGMGTPASIGKEGPALIGTGRFSGIANGTRG
jgi:hypothetical protein